MLVVRALYELKLYGADFKALLAERLHDLGYRPPISDPDVWMIPAVKPGGFMYYECVIFYVDDVIFISDNPLYTLKGIKAKLKLKGDKKEEPDMYLGTHFSKTTNVNGQECWDMSSENYCTSAVNNVESVWENRGLRLPPKCVTPMKFCYRPEMDVTGELKAYGVQWYQ